MRNASSAWLCYAILLGIASSYDPGEAAMWLNVAAETNPPTLSADLLDAQGSEIENRPTDLQRQTLQTRLARWHPAPAWD
jgi:hypothetical protein